MKDDGAVQAADPWREHLTLYRGSLRQLALSCIGSAGQSLLVIPLGLLVRFAFDRAVPAGDIASLVLIAVGIVALHLVGGAVVLWSRSVAIRITKAAVARLREELIVRIYALPRATMLHEDVGRTHSVVVRETERVDAMSMAIITQFLPSAAIAAVLAVFLAYLNWLLFLTLLAVLPVLMLSLRVLRRITRPRVAEYHDSFARFSKGVLFVLQWLDLTRSHAAETYEVERQSRNISDLGRHHGNVALWQAAHNVSQDTITSASWALILVAGGVAVAGGAMTIGAVLSFAVVAMMLRRAVNTMLTATPIIVEGRASMAAVARLRALPDDPGYQGRRRIDFQGRVRLQRVSFAYGPKPLLESIDLATEPGHLTMISGESGSGKTSLLYLVLGFYQPNAGAITADGIDYEQLDLRHLRAGIGFVPQDGLVFDATVLDNIAYGAERPDGERARAAARHALAHEFIEGLPQGYETPLGEGGALISGGQRQRIAIARALYRGPSLLLLDEPTSHLDTALARRLLETLRLMPEKPAILVASHDEAVAAEADEVFELRDGRLVRRATRRREAVA